MSVTHLAGATFTVTVGSTDYSAQITSGSIARAANVVKTKTLGPNTVATQTDREDTVDCAFLYDGSTGFYKALNDATDSLSNLTVTITGGTGKWTGSLAVSALGAEFNAEDVSTASATFEGLLTFAAVAP